MEYIFLFFFIIVCSFLDITSLKQKKICTQILLLIIYLYASLLTGLRYNVGYDYINYFSIYEQVYSFFHILLYESVNFNNIHGEYGFLILNSIIKSLFDDFAFVTMCMAFSSIGLVIYSCYKYSHFVFLSIYLYFMRFFLARDMGQIRSALACAIILYSLEAIERQQVYKFFALVIIASLFHTAALIVLPIYFLNKYDFNNKVYYFSLFISLILGIILPIEEFIKIYLSDYNLVVIDYALSEEYGYELSILNPPTLMQMFFLLLLIVFKKNLMGKIKYYKPMLNMYAFSTFWILIFNKIGIIAGRVSTMVTTVEIIIIPAVIFGVLAKNRYSVIAGYLMILLLGFLLIYLRTITDDTFLDLFMPYKSVIW